MAAFEVVFRGQVRPGVDIEQARSRIGQLFQVGERQLEVLFSGRRIVIKQGLDEAGAQKYREAIERAGALCEIVPMADEPVSAPASEPASAPAPTPAPEPARPAATAAAAIQPRDEYMAAFRDVQAPDLPIAPLGADMQDSYSEFTPLDIDLSAFSLAPVGSDMGQLPRSPAGPIPDTSHLHPADEGNNG